MVNVNVTEQHNRVIVQEDGTVRVVSAGVPGPPGPAGPPGDLDTEELEQMVSDGVDAHSVEATGVHGVGASTVASTDNVSAAQSAAQDHADTAVSDHNAATSVHGVDTTQLATQDDLANLEPLPEPGDDGDVLMLADGSPTWAAPEGGGGLDPDGEETITGDWHFDRNPLRVGSGTAQLVIGIDASVNHIAAWATAIGHGVQASTNGTAVGYNASAVSTQSTAFGERAKAPLNSTALGASTGRDSLMDHMIAVGHLAAESNAGQYLIAVGRFSSRSQSGNHVIAIGRAAARNNSRHDRLIIDNTASDSGNLVDPLIDGRFRAGTDPDSFEYSKGVKINGHLEATDQLILRSPDGTRWAITVDDSGNLSTTPATEEITP